jgi:hypothetical protein
MLRVGGCPTGGRFERVFLGGCEQGLAPSKGRPEPPGGATPSVLGDLGRDVLAREHPDAQDDELPQLALGAVVIRVAEGLGADLHLDSIALAGEAKVPVAELVTVPRPSRVLSPLASWVARETTMKSRGRVVNS